MSARIGPSNHYVPLRNKPSAVKGKTFAVKTRQYNCDGFFSEWTLQLHDPILRKQYIDFVAGEHLSAIALVVVVIIFFIYGAFSIDELVHPKGMDTFLTLLRHGKTFLFVFVAIYVYCIAERRTAYLWPHPFNVVLVGNSTILLHSVLAGLIILRQVQIGECEEGNDDFNLGCNESADDASIPLSSFIYGALCLMAIPVFVKCHCWWIVVSSIAAFTGFIVASLYIVGANHNSYINYGVFASCLLLALYNHERYTLRTFVGYMELEKAVLASMTADALQTMNEKYVSEMRKMIGNVSHDLKTPIQAMMFELETANSQATIQHPLGASPSPSPGLSTRRFVSGGKFVDTESMQSLLQSCKFMEMTINRSLDYMRATQGLELHPHIQRANIGRCMDLICDSTPLKDGVSLSITPIPENISSWLLLEQNWFVENALCLTSNAIKYSKHGCVQVRLRLSSMQEIDFENRQDEQSVTICTDHSTNSKQSIDNRSSNTKSITANAKPADVNGDNSNERDKEDSTARVQMDMLLLEVEDLGSGLSLSGRENIFLPLKQDGRSADGGIGMSLYALSERTQCLHGACGVRSRSDGLNGCLFWFAIPYHPIVNPSMSREEQKIRRINRRRFRGSGSSRPSPPIIITSTSRPTDSSVDREDGISISVRSFKSFTAENGDDDFVNVIARIEAAATQLNHEKDDDIKADHSENNSLTDASLSSRGYPYGRSSGGNFPVTIDESIISNETSSDLGDRKYLRELNELSHRSSRQPNSTSKSEEQVSQRHSNASTSTGRRSGVVVNEEISQSQPRTDNGSIETPEVNSKRLKVLVVDDAPLIRKAAQRALEKRGYKVELAADGQKCLDMMSTDVFDVILMDINMPIMGGLEASRNIRRKEQEVLDRRRLLKSPVPTSGCVAAGSVSALVEEGQDGNARKSDNGSEGNDSSLNSSRGNYCHERQLIIGFSANSENAWEDVLRAGMDDFLEKPLSVDVFRKCVAKYLGPH